MAYEDNQDNPYQWQPGQGQVEQGGITGQQGGYVQQQPPPFLQTQPAPMQQGQQQQTPQYAQQGGQPSINWQGTPDEIRQQVTAYGQTRGYNMTPEEANAWVGYAPDLYNRGQQLGDPNYGNMRLSLADQWTPQGQRYGGGGGGSAGPGAYVWGQGVPGMGSALGGQWGDRANSLYDLLMQRAGQSLNINRNDPIIRNLSDNYSAQNTRDMRNYLGDTAERLGPNANMSAERRMAAEKLAQGNSMFEAQLMNQELGARRNEIAQALQSAQGLGNSQQAMALQEMLSQLGLAQQAYQFDQQQQYAYSPFGQGY